MIRIKGAKQHNLKNIDIEIPRNKLVVLTGLSGSGKSSLAFDTIFAEGQRRYIESLSSYARQFLGMMEKPDVEFIEGLSPSISIDQKTTSHNPRSTVGTTTEIYDYFRLLYARIGIPHCPKCNREIKKQTIDEIVDKIIANGIGAKVIIKAPVVRRRKGEYQKQLEGYKRSGFIRAEIDGIEYILGEDTIELDKNIKHNINIVIDRIVVKEGINSRLTDSVEAALKLAKGLVIVKNQNEETLYSTEFSCPDCDISIEEITPRMFSFNTPYGACPDCSGLGFKNSIDINLLIKDPNKSLIKGAVLCSGWNMESGKIANAQFKALADTYGFSIATPFKDLPQKIKHIVFYGNGGEKIYMDYNNSSFSGTYAVAYEGIVPNLLRRYNSTSSEYVKREIEKLMIMMPCDTCDGKRLKKESLSVTIGGKNIAELCDMDILTLSEFIKNLKLTETEKLISRIILKEITARLDFLLNVGLEYLTLSRATASLSGGEAQRIRLATQIGSGLTGVIYILDEPSIGLHQRDNDRLIGTLKKLRDLDNTVLVVEHDSDTMKASDYIVDMGPGAGEDGGEVVFAGTYDQILKDENSITGKYLSGKMQIPLPKSHREGTGFYIKVKGAKQNNLKNIDVSFPLGKMTVVTGVSGSGKSSLINEILYPYLANNLNGANQQLGKFDSIEGIENCDKVIAVDQSPIGRTPRSNPATYTGVFGAIRDLFASTPTAMERGYKSGRFSFNVSGGRCENCEGDGTLKIEMHFLPDIYVPCDVCGGARYNRETLEVKYKGKNIADVLDMTVKESVQFFENIPAIYKKLKTLNDVGLGYIRLGQSSTTLSGGEAQRVKLATELCKKSTGKTIYILDEPTTGLHTHDVAKLIDILNKLADGGNTVIVIEHNLDVIKVADHIIDLGPEGGRNGGTIIIEGTPEQIIKNEKSYTGLFLKPLINN